MNYFKDRFDAGERLAEKLKEYSDKKNVLIFALPRGGVPVAYKIAEKLHLPLDVFLVRKLGTPFNEELAMGAISLGNTVVLNEEVIDSYDISQEDIERVENRELQELKRRNQLYRQGREYPSIANKTVILIDDGLATGATAIAAVQALKKQNPHQVILAVPVGSPDTCNKLAEFADEVVCLNTPVNFYAVGQAYLNFSQTTDREVLELLEKSKSL